MSAPNTTPAAPAAPATPAPSPINLDAGKDLTTLDDASLLSELGFEAAPDEAASPEPTPQELDDAVVNSVVPDATASDDQPTDEAATPNEPAAPAAAAPTPDTPAAEKQLAAKFTVEDGEGELEIPDLLLTFEADGGKRFEKVSLDKVVRLAQQGIYNHRLQTEVTQAREAQTRLSQAEAALETERQATQRAWSLAERLLTDQDFFDKTLAEYQDYNAPEAVIARQREEIESLRNRPAPHAGPTAEQQSQQWFEQTAIPAIGAIVQQSPAVTQQELLGQFMVLTAPLMVNGKIPPARFDDVSRLLQNELAPWAADLQEQRASQETARQAAAAAAEKAKLAAVNSKRQLARVIKPAGRAAPDAPKPRTARDADDAASLVLSEVFGR